MMTDVEYVELCDKCWSFKQLLDKLHRKLLRRIKAKVDQQKPLNAFDRATLEALRDKLKRLT